MLVTCSIGRTSHQSLILYTVARLDTRWRDIEDGNGLPITQFLLCLLYLHALPRASAIRCPDLPLWCKDVLELRPLPLAAAAAVTCQRRRRDNSTQLHNATDALMDDNVMPLRTPVTGTMDWRQWPLQLWRCRRTQPLHLIDKCCWGQQRRGELVLQHGTDSCIMHTWHVGHVHFLFTYLVHHLPYAQFIRTTLFPYMILLHFPYAHVLVLYMTPSLSLA